MARKHALRPKKQLGAGSSLRNWTGIALVLLMAFTLSVSAAFQNPVQSNGQQPGARNAGVKPKRTTERRDRNRRDAKSVANRSDLGTAITESLSPVLAAVDFDLLGLAVIADPASLTVPKNTPTAIHTSIRVPDGTDPSSIIAALNPNYRVRGELTGPSLTAPLALEAPIGQPLNIPPLNNAGDHLVRNLRVVDVSTPDHAVVTSVTPDSCGIVVIERLLVSEVRVNELSYDEIIQAGINITDDSYRAFNFILGIATSSTPQIINIPVAFPQVGVTDPRPVIGTPSVSGPGIDVPTVLPILLIPVGPDGEPSGVPPGGGEALPKIPGLIVFPGRVGFLHQFFEAIVIVGNGAPNGTPLVIHSLRAKAQLPDSGTPADGSDDPLRIAETQTGGRVSELDLHGLGPDNKYGTGDDTTSFAPGESGQATFLVEGLKEGLHPINFDLEAMLEGLPGGPVKVRGEVAGAVLVRDASFAVTFTHPGVVRTGNEYDLGMTVYNSGQTDINGAFAQLPPNSISGAEFVGQDTGQRQFATTIKRGESATVKWRLRANVTGEVTATYVKVGEGVSAGLTLSTGVGDRNIPLSPDSLILPDPVRHLPTNVVEAARALLGQAWSIANAPAGSLPQGVRNLTKQTVVNRAVELGIAGMRVDFGEPVSVSLDTVLRDWLGELQDVPDPGFADTQRNTRSGYEWFDSIGADLYQRLNAGPSSTSPYDLHQEFANTELARSRFISALVTHANGQAIVGARFVDYQGKQVGFGATPDERAGDLAQGSSHRLAHRHVITGDITNGGQMLVVSNPIADNWTLELNGWQTGTVDLSLVLPTTSQAYNQYAWSGVQITQGGKYRVRFRPLGQSSLPVLEEYQNGSWQAMNATPGVTPLNQPAPRVVGVIQVTPSVVAGGDKYGRLIGVLFSKPMLQDQGQTISRYKIGGGALKGSNPAQQVGDPIAVTGAKMDYGNRFVFLRLDSTVGPYIDRDLTISSMLDTRRLPLSPSPVTTTIVPRVSPEGVPPGAYLTGRVLNADGTPVVHATVITWAQDCPDASLIALPPPTIPIVLKYTDAQGRYEIDYVRGGDCAPLNVTVNNPTTHSEKRLTSAVAYDGQHMVLDMVFLARGNVEGNITSAGQPMPRAFVRVVPDLDVIGTKVVQADLNGHYVAKDVPVGNVSVLAVGEGAAHNASGFNAGTINGAGQTTFINVSLQNIAGVVRGHVFHADQTAAPGSLVVAYAVIAGFHPLGGDGAIAVGYAFADRDGSFTITNLPVGDVKLEVTDYVTGLNARQNVQLSNAIPEANGLVIILPGNGSVSGRVTDDVGTALPGVFVSSSGRAVQTDSSGNYTLQSLPAGVHSILAFDQATQRVGSAQAPVTMGQTTSGIDIVILRPSVLQGTVYVINEGTSTPVPAAGVKVSADGAVIVNTNAQGHYTITNVQPGDLLLRFVDTGKGYAINTPVKLLPGETLSRDATFRPGTVHGKVYQPDGVTPAIAQLSVYVPRPELTQPYVWGLLSTEQPLSTQSAADGSYSVTGLNPGTYRITTSNDFFPTRVSNGGTLPPGGNEETNLVLVSTLAGKIQGNIFQTNGTTLVGLGIRVTLSGGSLADVTVRTDDNGHYEFAEVFSAGSYQLTATDPLNGNTNRIGVSIQRNKDAVFDLRLLGAGNLHVQVLDGTGQAATGGSVSIEGTDYPNAHRFAEVPVGGDGQVTFNNLPEGSYAVSATRFGLGGRVSARVSLGLTVDVSVQLQATGNVEGHVYLPDGTTPISLADVQLRVGGRSIGFIVTSEEPEIGKFIFVNVPTGSFTLDAFDNHTGRVGRAAGSVTMHGETVVVNVLLLPVGAVSGHVTANGNGVDHASVHISADGSGVRGANLFATTDPSGHYRFTGIPAGRFVISVADAPGGQTGSASGTVSGTVEPLPDTIVNIALEPSQTVNGTVFLPGGTERLPGAQVTIIVGGRGFHTATNDQGNYTLGFIPLGQISVRAEAPVGYDRGEAAPVAGTQAGGTITANVTMAGVGILAGDALDSNGALLAAGTVTFTNDAWSPPVVLYASLQPNGHYEIAGAPAGHFSLRMTVPGRVGVGSASGDVLAGQTTNVPLRLEDAGTVTGQVHTADGSTPVQGASVSVTLNRPSGTLSFYAHTNAQGVWTLNNVPLGTLDIRVTDEVSGGMVRARNVVLATNGQTVDLGTMLLDSTPITVVSVEPANGATSLPVIGTVVRITFSEPTEASTVNFNTVRLQVGTYNIAASVSLSSDGRVATLTPPSNRLDGSTTYTVVVKDVEDRNGMRLASPFNSTFVTLDTIAPTVTTITPANNATEIPTNASVIVSFDESLDRNADLAEVIRVTDSQWPNIILTGSYELDAGGSVATFTPTNGFNENTRYAVIISAQRDVSGNVHWQPFLSSFATPDHTIPIIDPLQLQGAVVHSLKPVITATYHDNLSGIKASSVVLTVDNVNVTQSAIVTAGQVTYTPAVSLALGAHNVTVSVADNAGNLSALRTANFSIEDAGITLNSFKINGQVAVDGMTLTNVPRPLFLAVYTDETGIDTTQTKLFLSRQGETLQAVNAVVTQTSLSYQPITPLTLGTYTVQLVIVDQLGHQSPTGVIGFTLSQQSSTILSIQPSTGGTFDGTLATITGNFLVDTPVPPAADTHGISAEYYQNKSPFGLQSIGLRATRTDAAIDFNWENDTPSPYIDPLAFEAKWRGQIQPLYFETYTFHIDTDSTMQLWINGQPVVAHRIEDANIGANAAIDLVAGQRYDIRVEYKALTAYGQQVRHKARLFWSSPSQAQQIVPTAQLYPTAQPPFPLVFVGGQQATVIGAIYSPNQIACVIPPSATGVGPANVEVRNENGTAMLGNGFTYVVGAQSPRAIAFSVRNGAIEVPASTPLRVTFDKPLDGTQNLLNYVRLIKADEFNGDSSIYVPGTVALDETGRVATFIPATPLPDDDLYDLYGSGGPRIRFATADRTGPQIHDVNPENKSIANTTPWITAQYDDTASGVDVTSVELTLDGVNVSAEATINVNYLQFKPTTPLEDGTHTVIVRVKDLVGHLSTRTFSFTVIPRVPIILEFTIAGQNAVDGLATANRYPQIFVRFTDENGISFQAAKLFFGRQDSTLTLVQTGAYYGYNDYYLYYNPPERLDFGLYSVRFEATNQLGNTTTKTVNFEVADLDITPPQIVEVFPASQAVQVASDTHVIFTFDEALDPAQNFNSEFGLVDNTEQRVAGSVSLDATGRIVTFVPAAPLRQSTAYYTLIGTVRDLLGNENYYGGYSSFATVDSVPPVVQSLTISDEPADGLHFSLRQPTIVAAYSDDGAGIDTNTVVFTLDGVAITDGLDVYDSQTLYWPSTPLATGQHTVSIHVMDRVGNASNTLSATFLIDDEVSISAVTPNHGFAEGGEGLTIRGVGMINSDGSYPVVMFGSIPVPNGEYYVKSDLGTEIVIDHMPAGSAGTMDVVVQTDHGTATVTNGYTYEVDPKTPFAVEPDTLMLWHMDSFPGGCRIVEDASPHHNNSQGNCWSYGDLTRGRFSQGLRGAHLPVETDGGTFAFGTSSFTLEGWIRIKPDPNDPPSQPLNMFARADSEGESADYQLSVLPSGDVTAKILNAGGDVWQATMPASILNLSDNQWHSLAMVVERVTDPSQSRLVIYIDGEERASATAPANFGSIRDSGGKFVASPVSYYGWPDTILDEVRVSTTAHSADLIRRTYQGALDFVVFRSLPAVLPRGETTEVTVDGYHLDDVSAALAAGDGTPLPATITPLEVKHTVVRLGVALDQSVPLGPAILNLSSGGQTFAQTVRIVEQRPFAVDSGTVLLWHLDEPSYALAVDASPSGINGGSSEALPGRFGNARYSAGTPNSPKPSLSFGSLPFTVSCWIKTGVPTYYESQFLALSSGAFAGGYPIYLFTAALLPTGAIRVAVQSQQGTVWQSLTPAQPAEIANNRWHLMTVVVERGSQPGQNNLKIYFDGTERVSTLAPAGFGALPNANGFLQVNSTEGLVDEVRLLNYGQTATQVGADWFGPGQSAIVGNAPTTNQQKSQTTSVEHAARPALPPTPAIQILSLSAREVARDKAAAKPVVTALTIEGDGLEEINAHVLRDGVSLDGLSVRVLDSAARLAHIEVSVAPTVKLGGAQLVLAKRADDKAATATEIRIVEPSEFALEADTVGLWHLDERDEGMAHLLDSSEQDINLTSAQASRVAEGRFGGGRTLIRATADASSDALSLGMSSFTLEGWLKTQALERDYVLVGKETNSGQNTDFTLKALSSGGLRAEVYDLTGLVWQAETLPGTGSLTDGQWHAVALVVDREAGLLALYIDGQLHIAAPAPAGFAALRNLGQPLQFGCFDADGPSASGPEEFPGVLDEMRISSTAHKPEKIAADFFGHDEPQFTLIRPAVVRKGAGPVEVTLSGYGLAGATVTASQPGVTITVLSSTLTSIKLSLALSDSVPAGPMLLNFSDVLGRSLSVEFTVADRLTGNRLGSPGAKPGSRVSGAQGRISGHAPAFPGRRPPDPPPPNRTKASSGASFRSSRSNQDAKPVGGQR